MIGDVHFWQQDFGPSQYDLGNDVEGSGRARLEKFFRYKVC